MKTNPLRSKVAIFQVMGKLLGFAVISLQLGEICLAHDPGSCEKIIEKELD